MPKFNIYKLLPNARSPLVQKMTQVGLEMTSRQTINDLHFEFYLSNDPEPIDIWWIDYYRSFLEEEAPQNLAYYAVLLIFNNSGISYAISLGKSHFYLKNYCDTDFGISLAERIVDENYMKLKNSKFYKSKRSKTITSYLNNTRIDYDSGESLHYIKAQTINEERWGKVGAFGHSVQLNLDIPIRGLSELIKRIHLKLSEDSILSIPKAEKITDESIIQTLDQQLLQFLLRNASEITTSEYTMSGIDFIFSDSERYVLKNRNTSAESEELDDLNINNIKNFLMSGSQSNSINDILVKVLREGSRPFSKPIKEFLDYMDDERYCLLDGKWHKFNQSYIDLILQTTNQIRIDYEPQFDIQLVRGNTLREEDFNESRTEDGYLNVDMDLVRLADVFKVEKMDLYKDNTLFFVKKGTAQKLGYVIDQALATVNLLKHNSFRINIDGRNKNIKTICVWIIIERQTDLNNLSEIRSIIFQMKIMHLFKEVLNANMNMYVKLNYLRH